MKICRTLANELGVEMQKLAAEGDGEDLYFFKGQFHTPKDMVDPETQTGAFAPIAKQIADDADKLTDKDDNWTDYARKLDQMSLKAYLEQFRGKTEDWAIDLLDVAYNIEFGLLTEDQSSLIMVDFITTDLSKPFADVRRERRSLTASRAARRRSSMRSSPRSRTRSRCSRATR